MYSPDVFLGNFILLLMVIISTRNLFLVFGHGDIHETHCLISFRSLLECHFHGEIVYKEIIWYSSSHLLFFIFLHSPYHGRRQWHPTAVLVPGKSHGWRSLVGCSPWGHEELDTTEQLHFHFSLSCIGEGNGNPLQCSCLENPRDRGVWWATVYGVAQSRTWLKWLSSSSKHARWLLTNSWTILISTS